MTVLVLEAVAELKLEITDPELLEIELIEVGLTVLEIV